MDVTMSAADYAYYTNYVLMVLKLLACFVVILTYVRLSGKTQLAPMSATDQLGNMAIGGMVGTFVLNPEANLVSLVIVLVVWGGLLLGLRWIKFHSVRAKEVIDGKRIQLVADGRLLADNFEKSHLSVRDFLVQMNQRKIASFDDLKAVWYEQNGQFTFIEREDELLSIVVIEEGRVVADQLALTGHDEEWLGHELAMRGLKGPEEVFAADWHDDLLWVYRY